jgi:aminoglycoside phosphotransferase (APT) family kinase protein
VQGDQLNGCSVEVARATVAELAKLHGPRWGDAALHDVDWLSRRGPDDAATLQGMWSMFIGGFETIYRRHLTDEQAAALDAFGPRLAAWIEGRPAVPLSVTHGDFRLDNLLFGTPAGGPPVTAVDWQTPGHGAPIGDLSYFIGAGLLPDDRRAHERELLEVYGSALAGYGVAVDDTWLWDQYRREAFSGVIMAVVASQIVGSSERSEAMFTAMATRHLQQAIDLGSLELI